MYYPHRVNTKIKVQSDESYTLFFIGVTTTMKTKMMLFVGILSAFTVFGFSISNAANQDDWMCKLSAAQINQLKNDQLKRLDPSKLTEIQLQGLEAKTLLVLFAHRMKEEKKVSKHKNDVHRKFWKEKGFPILMGVLGVAFGGNFVTGSGVSDLFSRGIAGLTGYVGGVVIQDVVLYAVELYQPPVPQNMYAGR